MNKQIEYAYRGMSYRNVYDEAMEERKRHEYIFSDEYKTKTKEHDVGEGYTVRKTDYLDHREENGRVTYHHSALEASLMKDGAEIFSYIAYGEYSPVYAAQVIRHSNGREYFLFKENLYGLSVLDLSDGKTFRYIPEGYEHNRSYFCGESFIITDMHYDPSTDLIAFGGCYWAAPCDVTVADFSDPMNYDPHFLEIHLLIDPEYDEIDDIDFMRWENDTLVCSADKSTVRISIDTLRDNLNKLR